MHPNIKVISLRNTYMSYLYKISPIILFYFANVSIYYVSSILHAKWCTPSTWIGFLYTPFIATTPHCVLFQWVIYFGGNYIRNTWIVFGTYLIHMYLSWSVGRNPSINNFIDRKPTK